MSIYLESAEEMIGQHGYTKAKLLCIQHRDMNSPGTASFAFHNAVLKQIVAIGDDAEPLQNGPDTEF